MSGLFGLFILFIVLACAMSLIIFSLVCRTIITTGSLLRRLLTNNSDNASDHRGQQGKQVEQQIPCGKAIKEVNNRHLNWIISYVNWVIYPIRRAWNIDKSNEYKNSKCPKEYDAGDLKCLYHADNLSQQKTGGQPHAKRTR